MSYFQFTVSVFIQPPIVKYFIINLTKQLDRNIRYFLQISPHNNTCK